MFRTAKKKLQNVKLAKVMTYNVEYKQAINHVILTSVWSIILGEIFKMLTGGILMNWLKL